MPRLLLGIAIVVVVITVFTLVDCLRLERARVRIFPRAAWFFIVLLVPVVGAALWFIFGRGTRRSLQRRVTRTLGPDDDPDFLRRVGTVGPPPVEVDEKRLRELEETFAEAEDDQDPGRTER